ncbi:hypothetical protein JB92DRAFT_3101514 [Gautieria morchelliformis]|nr:hypothetical protein JB92DRAFT_3101514 [Gautieria morchelliformis]
MLSSAETALPILAAWEDNRVVSVSFAFMHAANCARLNIKFASYAMLFYDHLLTLKMEIEYIWPTPWSLGKCLYFATKYIALADGAMQCYIYFAPSSTFPTTCTILYKVSGGLMMSGMLVAELILVFRTWAIWGQQSRLPACLLLLLGIMAIPTVVFVYRGLAPVKFVRSPNSRLIPCWETTHPGSILFLNYIIVIFFESVILAVTMYKGVQHLRRGSSSFVVTLYRDGALYYVYMIGISIINAVVLAEGRRPAPSFILMQRALHSIFTARILLNLREAACRDRSRSIIDRHNMETTLDTNGSLRRGGTLTALSSNLVQPRLGAIYQIYRVRVVQLFNQWRLWLGSFIPAVGLNRFAKVSLLELTTEIAQAMPSILLVWSHREFTVEHDPPASGLAILRDPDLL